MKPTEPTDWARRLRPLHRGDSPIPVQLQQRRGVVLVATAILIALILFVLAIFTGFGRADLGLALGGLLFGPLLGWIWWDYRRLARTVAAYQQVDPAGRADESPL